MSRDEERPAPPDRTALLAGLYRDYGGELLARLKRVFGAGPPCPDDLAQGAFARLVEMDDLSVIRDPRAFLFRVGVNLGLDQVDKEGTARRLQKNYAIHLGSLQNQPGESVYQADRQLERLSGLIAQLPQFERELLQRSRFKGETLSSIAVDTKLSVATLSRRLAKVLETLKAAMADDASGAGT